MLASDPTSERKAVLCWSCWCGYGDSISCLDFSMMLQTPRLHAPPYWSIDLTQKFNIACTIMHMYSTEKSTFKFPNQISSYINLMLHLWNWVAKNQTCTCFFTMIHFSIHENRHLACEIGGTKSRFSAWLSALMTTSTQNSSKTVGVLEA